jgi:hypothetical protein
MRVDRGQRTTKSAVEAIEATIGVLELVEVSS